MVHDILGMSLNRITLSDDSSAASSSANPASPMKRTAKRSVEVGEGDFFWEANERSTFPKVAADVDVQLTKYKQVRRRSGCALPC